MQKLICSVLVLAVAAVGCSGGGGADRLPTHKVTGKVTMGGAAVSGATVSFSPTTPGKPAALGVTDTQGMFKLTTYDAGDGAVEGEYKVMVSKQAAAEAPAAPVHGTNAAASPPSHAARAQPAGGGSLLPEKYASAATTTITKSVVAGDNDFLIEL